MTDAIATCPNRPDPSWLTYEQARFYFVPTYTGRGRAWADSVWMKLGLEPSDGERLNSSQDDETLTIACGQIVVEVDSSGGCWFNDRSAVDPMFSWPAISADQDPGGRLAGATERLGRSRPHTDYVSDHGNAYKIVAALEVMFFDPSSDPALEGVDIAVRAGWAKIVARPASPLAGFVEVTPDQWRYFNWMEDQDDVVIGPASEVLYSVFVAPNSHDADLPPRLKKTSRAREECRRWLLSLMERSPNRAPSTKANLLTEATNRWPDLSQRSFNEAWRSSISEARATAWERPGPRQRSSH